MKDWYLIGRPSTTSGGFENDVFNDYKNDAIYDILDTELATTVLLYNYDLSESKTIHCIIQGNTADTQLKSMERIGLFVRGTVKAGMYIFFENRYWLITSYPGNNSIYEKATLQLCQYKLRWQNSNGKIVERWISASSAAKYDVGEKSNNTIILTTDNLTLLLPDDEESLNIDGKRVFIDKRVPPKKVYKITRSDDVLYDYGEHGAILSFIADKTELNLNTDRPDLRLCDYIDPSTPLPPQPPIPDETTDLSATISGNTNLKVGFSRIYTVIFTDKNGNKVDWDEVNFSWNVVSDFEIKQTITDNKIRLDVDNDDSLVGESFLLQILVDGVVSSEITGTIIDAV